MYKKLNQNVTKYWTITRIITFLIISIILFVGFYFLKEEFENYSTLIFIGVCGVSLYLFLSIFIYPRIEYAQWGYLIANDKIQIKHGIFFLKTSIIPIIRIQHLGVENGPLKRKFKINTIVITTASGEFRIEGLTEEEAEEITNNLKDKLVKKVKKELNM